MALFTLRAPYTPRGDQPEAIERLSKGLTKNLKHQTLLGVTGSGKTFTIANVIARHDMPTIVISHNKTLAAQLYNEFRQFFPENHVEYFVSYYDYYQPEAYIPHTDTYIEKDASINEQLDKLRLKATSSIVSSRDVIVVASVSCIYNLGSPGDFESLSVFLKEGATYDREDLIKKLIDIQYQRNDFETGPSMFKIRDNVLSVYPSGEHFPLRIHFKNDAVERIEKYHPTSGKVLESLSAARIFPSKHFVTTSPHIQEAARTIREELAERVQWLKKHNKLLEAQRLESRTRYDLEMLQETGYCHGIENYSRHLSARPAGSRPSCLLDYFSGDFLTIIDESHVTIPQIRGMYEGDRARKKILVEYGFRLASCLDNRPLTFEEFSALTHQVIFLSATPSEYESKTSACVVEQLVRPTGIVDPPIVVKPTENQIDDLIAVVREKAKKKERVLVTTLTKKTAETLASYLQELSIKVRYLHSEVEPLERIKILYELRKGVFDCLVGVNLLREGLDLPEVTVVAILDADKEGFLRSATSLIQIAGRAARNIDSVVIMYADKTTGALAQAIRESTRRRDAQLAFNKKHHITPKTIEKEVTQAIAVKEKALEVASRAFGEHPARYEVAIAIAELEEKMNLYARNLQFEKAIEIREKIAQLKKTRSKGLRASRSR